MPYIQCRNLLYTMHSAHEDFREIRAQLGIQGLGLNYDKLRDGLLTPNEERFLKEYVVPSMNKKPTCEHKGSKHSLNPRDYGDIHIEVADPDKTDFNINDLRSRSELIFAKTPFNMIVCDHVGLMSPRGRHGSTTERLNEVIRDLKKLAMSFNRGMGIAVVALFQISREGYRSAEKNGGRYNLTHLSYANEAERSADIVTASWVDESLIKLNRAIFQCLKSRDQAPFDRTPVRVEFSCRRLLTDNTSIEEIESKIKSNQGDMEKITPVEHEIPEIID